MKDNNREASQSGAVAILAALAAVVLLGFGAMAIDVGYGLVTRAELQNVADSAALAGNRELARIYDEAGNVDYKKYTLNSGDKARILQAANLYANQNSAAGKSIELGAGDITYGTWNKATGAVTAVSQGVDAVTIDARRDEVSNGPLDTLLAGVLGFDTMSVSADSASAISAASSIPAGKAEIPIGISEQWFKTKDSPCGTDAAIRFYPTGSTLGCAGWHTFESWPANASKLKTILNGLQNGSFSAPAMKAGETQFAFIGGTVASRFSDMQALFNAKKGGDGTWKVLIPVYQASDCSNPNGWITIVGFATARIRKVTDAPSKQIDANVECDILGFGESGGTYFGSLVSKPKMIH